MKKSKFGLELLMVFVIFSLLLSACGGATKDEKSSQTIYKDIKNYEETPIEDFEYEYDADTQGVQITKYTGTSIKVRMPDKIDGEPITCIGEGAFKKSGIMSVYIPDTVTVIKNKAFAECTGLISIVIPEGITKIGEDTQFFGGGAFSNCTGLTSIEIPGNLEKIGDFTFEHCTKLTDIKIENGVKEIGYCAFSFCESLTSIDIPDSVTEIGEAAFEHCVKLTDIVIPEGVTEIEGGVNGTFNGCTSLTNVSIPNTVATIGKHAFGNCTSLESITIPNSVTSIDSHAFWNCSNLKDVVIPNNIDSIDDFSFFKCTSLTAETKNRILSINPNCYFAIEEETTAAEVIDEDQKADKVLNGDFSDYAGTYKPDGRSFNVLLPEANITLKENGIVEGGMVDGLYNGDELVTYGVPYAGTKPISVTKSEAGSYVCIISEGEQVYDEEIDGMLQIEPKEFYIICPVGVTSTYEEYPGYDDLGTDSIRIRYIVLDGGIMDTMYFKV